MPQPYANDKSEMPGSEIKRIYEITDTSDDEIFYQIGVFSSLENAISMIDSWNESGPELENNSEFYQRVTVTERPLDECHPGKKVHERAWSYDFNSGDWVRIKEDEAMNEGSLGNE